MKTNLNDLVRRLIRGDEEAFKELYNGSYRQVFFVVLPIVRDKALAEDIVQDTYLKFLEKLNDLKVKNVLSYLITIGKNLAINEFNKRKRITKVDDFSDFSYYEHIEIKLERKEAIQKALSILDRDELDIFLLHVLEGLTHRELAIIMDKPLGTVSWVYAKAVKKLKEYLKGDNYEI